MTLLDDASADPGAMAAERASGSRSPGGGAGGSDEPIGADAPEDGGQDHLPADRAASVVRTARGLRLERAFSWVALITTIAGMLLVLFVGYLFVFTNLEGARNQRLLLQEFPAKGSGKTVAAGALAVLRGTTPSQGQPAALLQIPKLELSQVVVEGTSAADLQEGPGLMPGTAKPGERGNVVIAGRRLTFGRPFEHLLSLVPGDRIVVTGSDGTFTYTVTRTGIASAGMHDPVEPAKIAELTLVTSAPLSQGGREFVVARLDGPPVAYPPYVVTAPTTELALGGDAGAILPIVLWGFALVLAIVLTVIAYRRSRLTLTIYLLSTPILVALAIGCFENVARLLPAAF